MTTDNLTETASKTPESPRKRRRLFVGLALVLVAGTAALSAAKAHGFGGGWRHGGDPGEHMQRRIQRVLDKVGATDAQKAQIKATWDGLKPELKALHEQKAQLRQQITQAVAAPTIDSAHVEQLRKQSVQLMDRGSGVLTRGLLATAQVLTPEQRKKVVELMEKRRHRHGQGHDGEATR